MSDRQTDEPSREQRPLRWRVAQLLNKATCQTAVSQEKKQTLRSPKPDNTQTETHTLTSPVLLARLETGRQH